MKTFITLLFFLITFNNGYCKSLQSESGDFTLQLKFEESIILKDARLLGEDGSEIAADNLSRTFSGKLDSYGVFTLAIIYRGKNELHDESFSMPLLLQPGETVLSFEKIPFRFMISGASKESYKAYNLLLAKDEKAFNSVLRSKSQLNAAIKKGNNNLVTNLQKEVSTKEEDRKKVYVDYIKNNPTSIIALFAAEKLGSIDIEDPLEVEKAIHLLDDSLQKTERIIILQHKVETYKKLMVGQPAPEIAQPDTSGKKITLGDLRGKYVLIDFWASWCKPCRAQNPSLVKLYNKYKNKEFTILSISLDSYRSAWTKAIIDDRLEWMQISDLKGWKNDAAVTYNIFSVPQNYLLDKDGTIIAKNLSEQELQKKLTQIIY